MDSLIVKLKNDFPGVSFIEGDTFSWSPKDQVVTYVNQKTEDNDQTIAAWSVIHEVSHAQLQHTTYTYDIELIQLEIDAWQYAKKLAEAYSYVIDPNHIQDCLDTYREWLHKRSTCPICFVHSFQKTSNTYQCLNCSNIWKVTHSNICRPYRTLVQPG